MAGNLRRLPAELVTDVLGKLDAPGVLALARTNSHFYRLCDGIHGTDMMYSPRYHFLPFNFQYPYRATLNARSTPNVTEATLSLEDMSLSAHRGDSNSSSSSPSSQDGFDSTGSSDTDLTTPEEDDDYVWELTPEIMKRLESLPQHNVGATLPTLPTELQCEILSYLDKIDATCLGLTAPRTYSIYRSIFGTKMPLNTRRQGPNHLERAWEVVGKHECAQCGIYRCELHEHIKTWMPANLEYCSFKTMFGARAEEDMAENCFRGKPSKPRRCGRHPIRTTSVHQDDTKVSFAMTKLRD